MTLAPMTLAASPAPSAPRWLRVLLIAVALLDTLVALSSVPAIFYDYGDQTPLVAAAQTLNKAQLAIAPFLAGAALWFAIRHELRHAIVALAAAMVVAWITELPSIAIHGMELSADLPGMFLFARRAIYPVLAVGAIVLAVKNRRLGLAGIFVSVPTVLGIANTLMFAGAVMIWGF